MSNYDLTHAHNQGHVADFIADFATLFHRAGLMPVQPIADGKLHRIGAADEPRNLVGWYILHCDGRPAGLVGNWRTGQTLTWRPSKEVKPLSPSEWHELAQARQRRETAQQRQIVDAIRRANAIWRASEPGDGAHPYLTGKGVSALGTRQWKDAVVVPLHDNGSRLLGLQFIGPDGCKKFMRGSVKKGAYYAIGFAPGDRLLIAEGFATGASLHMATGLPVAVSFDAGNLKSSAMALRAKFSSVRILICADNDEHDRGLEAADAAALAVGGEVVLPPCAGQDFNDLHQSAGLEAVASIVRGALA